MKKLILLAVAIASVYCLNAQVLKRLGERAKNKMEQKAGDKVDKGIDDATDGKKKEKKPAEENTSSQNSEESATSSGSSTSSSSESGGTSSETASMKAYSKYDFIPGEKVFAYEDFSTAEIGDFPTRWNTNGTAEVVTLNNKPGKWLKMSKEA